MTVGCGPFFRRELGHFCVFEHSFPELGRPQSGVPEGAAFPDTRIAWGWWLIGVTAGGAFLFSWVWGRGEGCDRGAMLRRNIKDVMAYYTGPLTTAASAGRAGSIAFSEPSNKDVFWVQSKS